MFLLVALIATVAQSQLVAHRDQAVYIQGSRLGDLKTCNKVASFRWALTHRAPVLGCRLISDGSKAIVMSWVTTTIPHTHHIPLFLIKVRLADRSTGFFLDSDVVPFLSAGTIVRVTNGNNCTQAALGSVVAQRPGVENDVTVKLADGKLAAVNHWNLRLTDGVPVNVWTPQDFVMVRAAGWCQ